MNIAGVEQIPYYYESLTAGAKDKNYGELNSLIQVCKNYQQATAPSTHEQSSYDANQDSNCLRAKGNECIRCAYRFYIRGGRCLAVADECRDYNRETG